MTMFKSQEVALVGNTKAFCKTSHSCSCVLSQSQNLLQIAWGSFPYSAGLLPHHPPHPFPPAPACLQERRVPCDLPPLTKSIWKFSDLHSTAVHPFSSGLHFSGRRHTVFFLFFFLRFYLFIFREMGRKGKRRRETSIWSARETSVPLTRLQPGTWPATQASALTRSQTGKLLVCRTMPNPLSHTNQGNILRFPNYFHRIQN